MNRKILVSFLGTGQPGKREYNPAVYSMLDSEVRSSFISVALHEFLKPDKIILFGTMKSMWEALYLFLCESNGIDIDYEFADGLFEQAEKSSHKTEIDYSLVAKLDELIGDGWKLKIIKYGLSEQEIHSNFEIISEALNELHIGDEIFLDITHSFRSLPLFAVSAIDYINTVTDKNLKISKIYYGMLEANRELNNKTPIVDLSFISEIQNWTKGGYSFLFYGESGLIIDLLSSEYPNSAKKLDDFCKSISLNFIGKVKSQIAVLKTLLNEKYEGPSRLVVPRVINQFLDFFKNAKEESHYQLQLAKWHQKKGNLALAYICLVEAIITYICEKENIIVIGEHNRKKAKTILHKDGTYSALFQIYGPCNKIRNNSAHLTNRFIGSVHDAEDKLSDYLKLANKIIIPK